MIAKYIPLQDVVNKTVCLEERIIMDKIAYLVEEIQNAEAVVIGGGSGMSNAAGMNFWYEASPSFKKNFGDILDTYPQATGLFNMSYYHYPSPNIHWAVQMRMIDFIFNEPVNKPTYNYLKEILNQKSYHIVTTNQDGIFNRYFPEERISAIQGDWRYFQSIDTKTDKKLYLAKPYVDQAIQYMKANHDLMNLPDEFIPHSPANGAELQPWVRSPEFLEDKDYFDAYQKITHFLEQNRHKKILFLELGVGRMTPMFIQEPFWELTHYLNDAFYININPNDAVTNPIIQEKSLLIKEDINEVLKKAASLIKGE